MVFEISKYLNKKPKIDKTVFIAEGSNVIGSVEIKKNSSVWFNCTIRADVNFISIGEKTNIQDGTLSDLMFRLVAFQQPAERFTYNNWG